MTQTTNGLSFRVPWAQFSTQGGTGTWLTLDGYLVEIIPGGGERATGEVNTSDGDTPIVTRGKRTAETIQVKVVYTEEASATGAYETLRECHEGGTACYFRYAPKGSGAGNFLFTSGAGYLNSVQRPGGNVADAAAVLVQFQGTFPSFTKGTI